MKFMNARVIRAHYAGYCGECEDYYPEGTMIVRKGDAWCHAQCPIGLNDVHPVCQKCWLVHPEGECP